MHLKLSKAKQYNKSDHKIKIIKFVVCYKVKMIWGRYKRYLGKEYGKENK